MSPDKLKSVDIYFKNRKEESNTYGNISKRNIIAFILINLEYRETSSIGKYL